MKNKVLFKILISVFAVIALISNFSLAAYSDVTMTLEKDREVRIDITEYSYFEKKVVETDLENKEVTIQLSVVNNEPAEIPTGELMLVIDNSDSMLNTIGNKTRAELIHSSAKTLISKLLDGNDQLKIGVVSFSSDPTQQNDGVLENDAKVVSELSNDASGLSSAIDTIQDDGPRTDLDAGLTLAKNSFSSESNNKYIVVLTDGVPNLSLASINPYYSQETITKTKETLQQLDSQNINLITMLTGVDDPSYTPGGATGKNFGQIIEEIFGTQSNPTTGTFFYVQDSEIEQTITDSIFDALKPIYKTLTNIKVVDYFPQEIVDNFDFSYVSDATHGDISQAIDTENRSITWTIPKLDAGETATVQYKLKLKEEFDPQILDVLLNTNDGIDLDYDLDGEPQHQHSDESPQIKLTEPKKPVEKPADVAPIPLPKAGQTTIIVLGVIATGLSLFFLVRYNMIKNKMK